MRLLVIDSLSDTDGYYQNYPMAAQLAEALALEGNVAAQAKLGSFYWQGLGVSEDDTLAYAWWSIATALVQPERNGIDSEVLQQYRELARKRLTPEQFVESQRLSRMLFSVIRESEAEASGETEDKRGSGFLVGEEGHVVTNHHVVDGCNDIEVVHGTSRTAAAVVSADSSNDVALLRLSRRLAGRAATLRTPGRVTLGESILVAGYPFTGSVEDGFTVTLGNVSALTGLEERAGLFQLTAPVQQGNSGGPVLGPSGAVVGMVVGKLNALEVARIMGDIPQNVNFAVQGAVLQAFLDINGVSYSARRSKAAHAPKVRAQDAREFTVAVVCQ